MINTITRLSSLFLGMLIFIGSSDITALGGRYGRLGYGGYDGFGTMYQLEQTERKIADIQKNIADLRQDREQFEQFEAQNANGRLNARNRAIYDELRHKYGSLDGLDEEVNNQQEVLANLQANLKQLASGRPQTSAGQLVARGISGIDDFYMFSSSPVKTDDLWEGLKQGFILGTAREFGDFVRTKMRGVFQDKLGVLFDTTINGIADGISLIKDALFHNSKSPFTEVEVGAWQTHIRSIFDEIERITKDGLRDAYRSQDMTMRQTNSADDLGSVMTEEDQIANKAPVRIWADLFGGYVLQLSYYILVLQDRKGYYSVDSFEVFFATHLEERLQQFCNLLIKVNDLTDLDTHLAANKAVIPAYKSNIDNLFKQLQQQVKARTFTTAQSAASLFDRDKPRKGANRFAGDEYDTGMNDYPQSGWGGR